MSRFIRKRVKRLVYFGLGFITNLHWIPSSFDLFCCPFHSLAACSRLGLDSLVSVHRVVFRFAFIGVFWQIAPHRPFLFYHTCFAYLLELRQHLYYRKSWKTHRSHINTSTNLEVTRPVLIVLMFLHTPGASLQSRPMQVCV